MLRGLSPSVLTFLANKTSKLSFTYEIAVFKHADDFEPLNNDFKLTRFAQFEVRWKFVAAPRE